MRIKCLLLATVLAAVVAASAQYASIDIAAPAVTHKVVFDAPFAHLSPTQIVLPEAPIAAAVHKNGMRLKAGTDYNVSGVNIYFFNGVSAKFGDVIVIDYVR